MAQKKEYAASQKVLEAEAAVQEQKNKKPEQYQSAYEAQLKQVMDRILNREDFRYNLDGDALYRQYRNQAVQNGRLAMADTMGKAAALTGATAAAMPSPQASRPTTGKWMPWQIGFPSSTIWR